MSDRRLEWLVFAVFAVVLWLIMHSGGAPIAPCEPSAWRGFC